MAKNTDKKPQNTGPKTIRRWAGDMHPQLPSRSGMGAPSTRKASPRRWKRDRQRAAKERRVIWSAVARACNAFSIDKSNIAKWKREGVVPQHVIARIDDPFVRLVLYGRAAPAGWSSVIA